MGSLVSTKFRIPLLDAALVPRPALMTHFDRGLACQLTLVSAPAGYGKTTSTALWVHSLSASELARTAGGGKPDLHIAWYALDSDDNEFTIFFTRLVAAIETVLPNSLADVPTGLDLQAMPPAAFANRLAQACLHLPGRVVLVLDDFHVITTPAIHSALAHLIQYAWDRVHLVIASRHDPPLPIPRLRVQRQVLEVRAHDLRMTAAEAGALLAAQLDAAPPPETVALLVERTEGWVAGLQLAAIALEQEDGDDFVMGMRRAADRHVTDFLIDEVLERAPAELRHFLLATALVARFNDEVATRLTGFDLGECRRSLDQLLQRNLFLVVLDRDATWFRYHHQFRAMLLSRSALALRPEEAAARRRCVIEWLVQNGWIDEAIAELVADCDWEAAADLIAADRHQLYNREQWLLVWRRLSQLPPEIVDRRPDLLLSKAWVLQTQLRNAAVSVLCDRAEALIEEQSGVGGPAGPALAIVQGELAALKGSWVYGPGDRLTQDEQRELSEQSLTLLQPAQQYAWVRGYCYISLTRCLLTLGQREAVQRRIEQDIYAADSNAGPYVTRLQHSLGLLLMWDGALEPLLVVAERYLQLATQHKQPLSAAWANIGIGWVNYQQGRHAEAMSVVLRVFDRPHQVHIHATLIGLHLLIPLATDLGRLDEVAKLINQLHRHALDREAFVVVDELAALGALVACRRGDQAKAQAWATGFVASGRSDGVEPTSAPILTGQAAVLAEIALALGAEPLLRRAVELLQRREALVKSFSRKAEMMQCDVLLACCYRRLGQPVAASHALEQALLLGWGHGFRAAFLEHSADLAPLAQTLLQRHLCPEAAGALLEAINGQQTRHRPENVPLAYRPENIQIGLTEREAEVLEMLAQKLSNKEIAAQLHISPFTVRNHTASIFGKLNVNTRRQAIAQAQALHLLPPA